MIAALETAIEIKADIVCIQEPASKRVNHPGFNWYLPETQEGVRERVWIAVRKEARIVVEQRTDIGVGGDIQIIDTWEREEDGEKRQAGKRKGRRTRIVNVYDSAKPGGGRVLEDAEWNKIITGRTIICGDFNAHSPVWNPRCIDRRNHKPLEKIIEEFDLIVNNDDSPTYAVERMSQTSIIDLTLTTIPVGLLANWAVERDNQATMSDHAVITWELEYSEKVENDQQRRERLTTGWDIKGMMEEEPKEGEEAPLARDLAEKEWKRRSEARARLGPEPTRVQIEAEAKWMGGTITAVLNQYAKQLRITARSKRWWSEDINECRKAVSTAKTAQRHGVGTKQEVRKTQKDLHKTMNKEKRQMWGGFLQGAERDQHWLALRYCSPWASNTTPGIRTQLGKEAVTLEEKDKAFRESPFPPPPAGEPAELPEGGRGSFFCAVLLTFAVKRKSDGVLSEWENPESIYSFLPSR